MGQPQRRHSSALAVDVIRAWCWLAVTWQREAAEPEGCQELDTEHDHAQHASLRYVLSSTRSRSQQSLTSAGSPRPSSARDDLSARLGAVLNAFASARG